MKEEENASFPFSIDYQSSFSTKLATSAFKTFLRLNGVKTLHPQPILDEKGENHKTFRTQHHIYDENGAKIYRRLEAATKLYDYLDDLNIVPDIFEISARKSPNAQYMGTRKVLSQSTVTTNDSKPILKLKLGEYVWTTYSDARNRINSLSWIFHSNNFDKTKKLALFTDTCSDWMLTAFSLFNINSPVVTVYSTLSDEAILHALNTTQVEGILVDRKTKPRLISMLSEIPLIKHIFCVGGCSISVDELCSISGRDIQLQEYDGMDFSIISDERLEIITKCRPVPEDIAFIMFTSGSTGLSKGVLITHTNIISAISSLKDFAHNWQNQIYCAYLPQAHILEFIAELAVTYFGGSLGFGHPLTLFDTSPMLAEGTKGDLTILRPTIFATVPLVMERVKKAVLRKIKASSNVKQALFRLAYTTKFHHMKAGLDIPILDKTIFKNLRAVFGGRVQWTYVGGASLQKETEDFFNVCFGVFKQGYGLTESCCGGCLSNLDYWATNNVGPPTACNELKLLPWEEGGYFPTDPNNPRGEIAICGKNISVGYYANPELTQECFVKDPATGKVWFHTGDIAEQLPDGTFRIIDRKKDIIKLSHGEYISLAKIEQIIMTSPLVEMVCVAPNSTSDFLVALIVINHEVIQELATQNLIGQDSLQIAELLKNPSMVELIQKNLLEAIRSAQKLSKYEVPQKFVFLHDMWTPDTNLTTPSMKLRRAAIAQHFREFLI